MADEQSKVSIRIMSLEPETDIEVILKSGLKIRGLIDENSDGETIDLIDGIDVHIIDPREIAGFTWIGAAQ